MTQSPCLAQKGRIEMDQQQVETILAEHYHSVSSNNNSEPIFMRIKQLDESQQIDFLYLPIIKIIMNRLPIMNAKLLYPNVETHHLV